MTTASPRPPSSIALATTAQKQSLPALLALLERETDRAVFHAAWRALRELPE